MEKEFFDNLILQLAKANHIVLVTHHNPDGDALGSSLALNLFFKKAGKNSVVITPNDFPEFYKWMPSIDDILIFSEQNKEVREKFANADMIFCLDFNQLDRLESLSDIFFKASGKKVLIDHHQMPSDIFDFIYSETETSSTSELVYNVIQGLNGETLVDKNIATCLYVGIITDTGSFSYNCDYPNTYNVTSKLFNQGINGEEIHRCVYNTFSESRIRLLGYCLGEKLKIIDSVKTAYIALSENELRSFSFSTGDTEGIVNYGLTIKGIKISALFSEKPEYTKLSLRSTGSFNVGAFSRKHFNGGGHKNAAGANIRLKLDAAVALFEKSLLEYKDEILK